jgi:hypothetical protein
MRNRTAASRHPRSASELIRASVSARIDRWVETTLRRMSDEDLQRFVEAQSPAETVAEILTASSAGTEPNDWTELLLRGAQAKREIAERAGGLLSSSDAARVAGISVAGVKQRVERGKLLAVPLSGGQWGFPALQFDRGGRLREGVAEVLAAGAGVDPWTLLSILTDEPESGTEDTLLEGLGSPEARADVIARLAGYGEQGAA